MSVCFLIHTSYFSFIWKLIYCFPLLFSKMEGAGIFFFFFFLVKCWFHQVRRWVFWTVVCGLFVGVGDKAVSVFGFSFLSFGQVLELDCPWRDWVRARFEEGRTGRGAKKSSFHTCAGSASHWVVDTSTFLMNYLAITRSVFRDYFLQGIAFPWHTGITGSLV